MIKTNELRGIIVAKGMTQEEVAKKIGMTSKTFYLKMKKGVFGSDEIEGMVKILGIQNPGDIFFAQDVT